MSEHVLIVTGGLITSQERSAWSAARKCYQQFTHAQHAWLDAKIKLAMAQPLLAQGWELRRRRRDSAVNGTTVQTYFDNAAVDEPPDLTQVVLGNYLTEAAIPWQATSLSDLFEDSRRARESLSRATCVLLSSTYLHDLSELSAILRRLAHPARRLVVGGALMGALPADWPGLPEIDLVAVGYGEYLLPCLADWIRSGYTQLSVPLHGSREQREHSTFLFSGTPTSRSLDHLPTPDWSQVQSKLTAPVSTIYYESVRGCPYRCNFCNYPYLFADRVFRYKSAERMVDDWQHYVETLGIKHITCLDSLFTMPPERLTRFCELLIQRRLPIQWMCYARADDLARDDIAAMMKQAGAQQVQIGVESGDDQLLANMNKQCTVSANGRALDNCRRYGLTSIVSLIVGFPGETTASLDRTYRFLTEHPPDFYFLAAFSVRAAGVPLLEPELRHRFKLQVAANLHSMAPYWQHATMSCLEVGDCVRALDRRLMQAEVALNATLFYAGMRQYQPSQRAALLAFQRDVATRHRLTDWFFDRANRWVNRRLQADLTRCFGPGERSTSDTGSVTPPDMRSDASGWPSRWPWPRRDRAGVSSGGKRRELRSESEGER